MIDGLEAFLDEALHLDDGQAEAFDDLFRPRAAGAHQDGAAIAQFVGEELPAVVAAAGGREVSHIDDLVFVALGVVAVDDHLAGLAEVEVHQHAFLGGDGDVGTALVDGCVHFGEGFEGLGVVERLVLA